MTSKIYTINQLAISRTKKFIRKLTIYVAHYIEQKTFATHKKRETKNKKKQANERTD